MKSNRRNFLKLTGLTGLGMLGSNITKGSSSTEAYFKQGTGKKYTQKFNMCGYSAPKLEKIRVGHIGLGNRGPAHVSNMTLFEGVEVRALCDLEPAKVEKTMKRIESTGVKPVLYSGEPEAWKRLCERDDIDLVFIATPWNMHAPMAIYAMEQGKHVAIEVPAATTLDQCWQLVETSERTRKHCALMENDSYDFFELLTLNMARQGFFGDIVHGEGAYIHDLMGHNFSKTTYWNMWRLRENSTRQGHLYPTHGLGPIFQLMDINRGDKLDILVSVMSKDFMMNKKAKELAATDGFFKEFVDKPYRGNMTTTLIRTNKGKTVMGQHDVSSPNVYSRIHKVSGTKAAALKYPFPSKISIGDKWVSDQEYKELEQKYQPEIIKRVGEMAKKVGGHGGTDFLEDWRLIDCLRNGLPIDQDCYDAALWSAIAPLSEISVAKKFSPVDVPDFTGGAWKTNKPVDILLEKGGNTKVIR